MNLYHDLSVRQTGVLLCMRFKGRLPYADIFGCYLVQRLLQLGSQSYVDQVTGIDHSAIELIDYSSPVRLPIHSALSPMAPKAETYGYEPGICKVSNAHPQKRSLSL